MPREEIPVLLIDKKRIAATVGRLAGEITRDYRDKNPVLVGILKGSFIFLADLARLLDFPFEIEFVRLSSYGQQAETSGEVKLLCPLYADIKDRHVILIEDIVDTGLTIDFLLKYLKEMQPASVKLCALLDKPSRRKAPVEIDYLVHRRLRHRLE
jgi:hypoxanthine phosphoribosyltransferase